MVKRTFPIKPEFIVPFIMRLAEANMIWTSTPIIKRGRVVRYDVETTFDIPVEAFPEMEWVA